MIDVARSVAELFDAELDIVHVHDEGDTTAPSLDDPLIRSVNGEVLAGDP